MEYGWDNICRIIYIIAVAMPCVCASKSMITGQMMSYSGKSLINPVSGDNLSMGGGTH